jgi:hypothetical protein
MPLLSHHGHQAAKGTCASDDSGGPSHPPFVVLRRTSLTLAQEKIVDEKVTDIQSDAPIFVAYMSMEIVGDNGTFSLVSFSCTLQMCFIIINCQQYVGLAFKMC